ncbi:MAG: spore germination protein [Clostridiales bacterium]|jgi:spore germination protein KA/spore germination protein|nr:spore germination protein [Clostridiales bacterium]
MMFIKKSIEKQNQQIVDDFIRKNQSAIKRVIKLPKGYINLLYVPQITDRQRLSEHIIEPLIRYINSGGKNYDVEYIASNIVDFDDLDVKDDISVLQDEVLDGHCVLIMPNSKQFIVFNTKNVAKKGIQDPKIQYTLRGPKDCFNENMDENLSLIKYRIKDNNLTIDKFKVGERTKTNVAMIYLTDVVNNDCVEKLTERINEINVDGVLGSADLQNSLSQTKWDIFPEFGIAERSDMAIGAVLEGKVIILVEGSGLVLIAPKTFTEYMTSCDDYYNDKFYGMYSKLLRYVSLFLHLLLAPMYVAIKSFNTQLLSGDYTLTLATLSNATPFNALTETLIVMFIVELMRECLLRVPREIGSSIGIVGAVVIGQSAVTAGVFSPIILIIATLSLLSSFVAPDYIITNACRYLNFIIIIMAGTFGIVGVMISMFILSIKMVSTESFGVPFMAPYAPWNTSDARKTIIYDRANEQKRPKFLELNDETRKTPEK